MRMTYTGEDREQEREGEGEREKRATVRGLARVNDIEGGV
jgi:hypothetical protein